MTIDVVCALILRNGCVLCAQRSERMALPLKWEFPGESWSRGRDKTPFETKNFRRVNIFDVYILNVNTKNDNKAFAQNFTEKFCATVNFKHGEKKVTT